MIAFLSFALATTCCVAAEPSIATLIDTIVAAELARQHAPGAAVAVIHRGKVVVAKGYGIANVEHQVPVTDETIFQSGSIGKQFTAVAVMLLVEDGKLALDDTLSKFYPTAPAAVKDITVRQLLTHTSGIPDYTEGQIDLRRDYTEDELVQFALKLEPEFAPGTDWNYSNTGYVMLGAIIRKASGQFYGDVLRDRVFKPLGMTTARVISEADIVPHRAAGYELVDGEIKNQQWVAPQLNTTADGALYVSLRDMIAWDKCLREAKLLKPESWQAIYTPVQLTSGETYPYGFGWAIDDLKGRLCYSHAGAWQGFQTNIARYQGDDSLSIIVLMNLDAADPSAISDKIFELFE